MKHKTTRRVIEAIPADNSGWKPDPTSKSALAASIKTPADLLKWYDENHAKALSQLTQLKGDSLAPPIDFFGMFKFPAITYAGFQCSHSIHHRGQLSSYLRPMGGKVPSIYGPR